MMIQLNTDKNISGNEKFESYLNTLITEELTNFSEHITRIEVHLADENGAKKGENDKRCMLEARLKNMQPITVTCHENTVEKSVDIALDKLKSSMETIYDRLENN
jgi:ribosome-associated translation inhibitor RaiA